MDKMGNREYVSEVVKESYKDWENGDIVCLFGQTGCGKSTFIAKILLKYVINSYIPEYVSIKDTFNVNIFYSLKKSKIIYFCNRRALMDQLEMKFKNSFNDIIKELCDEKNYSYSINDENECNYGINENAYNYTIKFDSCIQILSYQSFETSRSIAESTRFLSETKEFEHIYYVFDEAHYIFNDSTFNSNVSFWISNFFVQMRKRTNGIFLFLTATPDEMLPLLRFNDPKHLNLGYPATELLSYDDIIDNSPISEYFDKKTGVPINLYKHNIESLGKEITISYIDKVLVDNIMAKYNSRITKILDDKKIDFLYSSNKPYKKTPLSKTNIKHVNYHYLWPLCFDSWSEIIDKIVSNIRNGSSQKWLIFVDNKMFGMELLSDLASKLPEEYSANKLGFITSASKYENDRYYSFYKKITDEEKFDGYVLLATSVIFNGITICDDQLTNIVIPYTDKVDFLQSLGRIRLKHSKNNPRIRLYIKFHSRSDITRKRRSLFEALQFLIHVYNLQNIKLHHNISDKKTSKHRVQAYDKDSTKTLADSTQVYENNKYIEEDTYNKFKNYYNLLIHYDTDTLLNPNVDLYKNRNNIMLRDFDVSVAALYHVIYLYSFYTKLLESSGEIDLPQDNSDGNPSDSSLLQELSRNENYERTFFLIEQLSWIFPRTRKQFSKNPQSFLKRVCMKESRDKIYYNEKSDKLRTTIDKYLGKAIPKEEQPQFRYEMYEALKIAYGYEFRANDGRYNIDSPPGKNKLNKILAHIGLTIVSKQGRATRNKTNTWFLEKIQKK